MNASYHYITLDHKKTLNQIENRESDAIKGIEWDIVSLAILKEHGKKLPIPEEFM